ncbi:hypothetical protein F4823DRAFT_563184 [Ustulina deusta]|nr:hypothetical protein F4823DRAFT_563184 [Ustulina deusta]
MEVRHSVAWRMTTTIYHLTIIILIVIKAKDNNPLRLMQQQQQPFKDFPIKLFDAMSATFVPRPLRNITDRITKRHPSRESHPNKSPGYHRHRRRRDPQPDPPPRHDILTGPTRFTSPDSSRPYFNIDLDPEDAVRILQANPQSCRSRNLVILHLN